MYDDTNILLAYYCYHYYCFRL